MKGNTLTNLSDQQITACSSTAYGCNGGWPYWAYGDLLKSPYNGGVDSQTSYPYTGGYGDTCKFNANNVAVTIKSYTTACSGYTAVCSEESIKTLVYTVGPVSACLDANSMVYYSSGIDNPSTTLCPSNYIDHCVAIVGYGVSNGTPYWKIKNSWGTSWGEQGYYRLIRGKGACGINTNINYVTI